jgi:hypothetical protein
MKKAIVALVFVLGVVAVWQTMTRFYNFFSLCFMENTMAPYPKGLVVLNRFDSMHFGFIDHSGKVVIPGKFDDAGSFHNKLCPVRIGRRWGYIDHSGKLVIPTKYSRAHDFSEGLAAVRDDVKWGYMDKSGRWHIRPTFTEAGNFEHGMAIVRKGRREGVIDTEGNFILAPEMEQVYPSTNGVRMFKHEDGLYGYLSENGKVISKAVFSDARPFSEDLAAVCRDEKWGFINKAGAFVIEPTFQDAGSFHHGLAVACVNRKFGLINAKAKFVLPPKYPYMTAAFDNAPPPELNYFSEGLVPIMYEGHWGFASVATGQTAIKPDYGVTAPFSEGVAVVGIYDHPEKVSRHPVTYDPSDSSENCDEDEDGANVDEQKDSDEAAEPQEK